jgi:REP element-mobilizing transposase RayT
MRRSAAGQQLVQDTYTKLHYHVVFSTLGREPYIADDWRERLHQYIGGTIRGLGGQSLRVGGTDNHVHILVALRPSHRLSDVMREVKHESSRWIHEIIGHASFAWQKGYGAFTVSPLAVEKVREYIANQGEHHAREPFSRRSTMP